MVSSLAHAPPFTEFCENGLNSFCIILLIKTNKLTNGDENVNFLATAADCRLIVTQLNGKP